jgi:uncharacterized repeat protein (TIGR01451 family)/CSLREA domain-containing protein
MKEATVTRISPISPVVVFCLVIVLALVASVMSGGILSMISRSAVTVHAAKRGRPWINFQDGRELKTTYVATAEMKAAGLDLLLKQGQAQPSSLTSGDLNKDGFPDLISTYASPDGSGLVTLRYGDPEAFGPQKRETIEGIKNGRFPEPFLPKATALSVPEAPDFVVAGDFDHDSYQDILTAARGSATIYLLAGDGSGRFFEPDPISLPGQVTALISEIIDRSDPYPDVVVAVVGADGPQVLVYAREQGVFTNEPVAYPLPTEATALALGQLDDKLPIDLAVAAGNDVVIIHGVSELAPKEESASAFYQSQIERISFPYFVASVATGDFIPDRDYRVELALLSDDGSVHIIARGRLDTRPVTPEEGLERRRQWAAARERGERPDMSPWRPSKTVVWNEAQTLAVRSPLTGQGLSKRLFLSGNLASSPGDDLVVVDTASNKLHVLMSNPDSQFEKTASPAMPELMEVSLDVEGAPLAALAMRLNVMAQPGLVVLRESRVEPTVLLAAALASFSVSKTADTNDGTCNADCSLREAIVATNASAGADMITFAANLPVLTITGSDNLAANGDLDINDSLTIMGNGSGTTIIDTNYTTNCGDCKVFGINQSGMFSGLTVSFSSLTVQDGFNDHNATGSFQETGGGIDFFLTGLSNTFSMTNCVVTSNVATTETQSYGGGINIDSGAPNGGTNHGTVTLTNCTISNNTADSTGGGINNYEDIHNLTISGCTISGNTTLGPGGLGAQGGGIKLRSTNGGTITIQSSTMITNNTAEGFGGGLDLTTGNTAFTFSISDTTISNNTSQAQGTTASAGGGLSLAGNATLTNVTISNNHSDESSSGNSLGGGIFMSGGTVSISGTSSISSNTSNGTSGRGGGVAINGGTLNLNSVTVSSNQAAGDGGAFFVDGTGTAPTDNAKLNITGGSISSNSAANGGALASKSDSTGTTTITSTPISNNTATTDTGGVLHRLGTTTLDGITFTGNTSPSVKVTGGTVNTANTVDIDNSVTIAGGTLSAGSSSVFIAGNFTFSSGTFTGGTSTFTFDGTSAQSITGGATATFNHLTDANTSAALSVNNNANANGNLTVNASAILTPAAAAIIGGTGTLTGNGRVDVTRTAMTADFLTQYTITNKTLTNLTVNYSGAGNQTVNNSPTYNHLMISGSGTKTLQGATDVNKDVLLTAATLDASASNFNMTVGGNWTNTGGTFTPRMGAVTFDAGSGTQTISGTTTFYDLIQSNSGATLAYGSSSTTIANTLSKTAGTMDSGTSTITFTGAAGSIIGSGAKEFNNLVISMGASTSNSSGGNITIKNDYTNNGTFTQHATIRTTFATGADGSHSFSGSGTTTFGKVDINSSNTVDAGSHNFNVAGDAVGSDSFVVTGTFTGNMSTVTFNGSAAQIISGNGAKNFSGLTINNASGVAVNNATPAIDASVSGALTLTTDLTVASGAVLQQTGTSAGTADAVGTVRRTDLGMTARAFGSPQTTIAIDSGTAPTQMDVTLVKMDPADFPTTAVERTYTLTPTGGSGISATLKLHYLDSELNGIPETSLIEWKKVGMTWLPQGRTGAVDTVNNAVTLMGVSSFSDWTLSDSSDLTATKTNNVSGTTTLGNTWDWTITVANSGSADATFTSGQTILSDNLPNSNISYGSTSIVSVTNVTGQANISCSIMSNNLTCTASGGSVTVGAVTGTFGVQFTATPSAVGMFANPRAGGACSVDPNDNVSPENDENNNSCSNTVTVIAPDLTAAKTNNVSGATTLGNNWTWTITVNNSGNAVADFMTDETILTDNLPNSNISYGAATPGNFMSVTGSANISCSIMSNDLSCTATGAVSIAAGGSFTVQFTATPSAIGTFANPRMGGSCSVDPNDSVTFEGNEGNNSCSDSVTVTAPDLTATKQNNVSGTVVIGNSWTWTIKVDNVGNAPAVFTSGQTILTDNLPDMNISYGSPSVTNVTNVTNSGNISCSIMTNNLTCTASGATVTIGATTGTFSVTFTATPTTTGLFVNPRMGGLCKVDPTGMNGVAVESNEANNGCSDTVDVTGAELTAVKSNNVSGSLVLGNNWTWTIRIASTGVSDATFTSGQTILTDNLPNSGVTYGAVSVVNVVNVMNSGNINCGISSNNLSCTASGGSVVLGATTGRFDVEFTATPSAAGTFANPRMAGICAVDPNNNVGEVNEMNNGCSDSVMVTAPDLTAMKANNVGGTVTLGNNWTWTITVGNGGNATANFASGQTIFTDNLPSSNVTYGSVSVINPMGIGGGGMISCSIMSNDLTCTASSGSVTIAAAGGFQIQFTATPSAIGAFANPRMGGLCKVDPTGMNGVVIEGNEANNGCSDTVTVTAPDLTATKTNNVGGSGLLGGNWTWTITVANAGNAPAMFGSGQTILFDNLPNSNISYGAATPGTFVSITNSGNISCSIVSNDLTCTANGAAVTIAAGGSFTVQFTATPSATGTFANPRSMGSCSVDPNNNVMPEGNEGNNSCSDSVTVTFIDLTATKTNSVSGAGLLGGSWTWTITVANGGTAAATFTSGQTILTDNLPDMNISYGSPSVTNVTNVTNSGNISCSIMSNNLTCTASGATVTIGAMTGSFDVQFTATPSATGTFANPRMAGLCKVDPTGMNGTVTESDEANNGCGDTVNVLFIDLTVSKANNVGGATTLGNSWNWTLTVANSGTAGAIFTNGQTVLSDNLPNSGVSYGMPTVVNVTNVTNSGDISCSITMNNLTCTVNGGPVTIGAMTGTFGVQLTATPSAIGAFTNPRALGVCQVDPNNNSTESVENNNDCNSDGVTVTAPELTATKMSNTSSIILGGNWTWTITVANGGNAAASFASGQTIVSDNLPLNASYGAPSVVNVMSVGNSGNISCSIVMSNLTCTASGATVTIAAMTGTFGVQFTVTPSTFGTFANPRGGGVCAVDPNNSSAESNEANNGCSDSVLVIGPPAISKAFGVMTIPIGGTTSLTFTITNANATTMLTNVGFTDTLPAGLVVATPNGLSGSCGGGTITATAGSNMISLTGATLAASSSCVFSVNVLGTTVGMKNNTTTNVTSTEGGNGNTASATVTVAPLANLSITKTDSPDPIQAGAQLTYTLVVNNAGPNPATGVTVTDTLNGTVFLSVMTTQGSCTFNSVTKTLTCNLGSLAVAGTATITLKVIVAQVGTISNTATVTANEADPVPANNSDTEQTTGTVPTQLPGMATVAVAVPEDVAAKGSGDDQLQQSLGLALLVSDFARDQVMVLLSRGDGTFRQRAVLQVGDGPTAMALADFNRDRQADIVVANELGNSLSILLGTREGTFLRQRVIQVGLRPTALGLGDLNGDSFLDIAVTLFNENTVMTLLGRGDGTFQTGRRWTAGQGPTGVAVGDYDDDGRLDLAVSNFTSNDVTVLKGRGDGTFDRRGTVLIGGEGPMDVAVTDLNEDGAVELVTMNFITNDVTILKRSNSRSGFEIDKRLAMGLGPMSMVAAPLLTGRPGIAVANLVSAEVAVQPGDGVGRLGRMQTYTVVALPIGLTLGDFNGDGRPDLAVLDADGQTIKVLFDGGDGKFKLTAK